MPPEAAAPASAAATGCGCRLRSGRRAASRPALSAAQPPAGSPGTEGRAVGRARHRHRRDDAGVDDRRRRRSRRARTLRPASASASPPSAMAAAIGSASAGCAAVGCRLVRATAAAAGPEAARRRPELPARSDDRPAALRCRRRLRRRETMVPSGRTVTVRTLRLASPVSVVVAPSGVTTRGHVGDAGAGRLVARHQVLVGAVGRGDAVDLVEDHGALAGSAVAARAGGGLLDGRRIGGEHRRLGTVAAAHAEHPVEAEARREQQRTRRPPCRHTGASRPKHAGASAA